MEIKRPHDNCYWLVPGRLLAGEYPGHPHKVVARRRLENYLDVGITFFVDLTEAGELVPYEETLAGVAETRNLAVEYRRLPIRDVHVPDAPAHMRQILDTVDAALAAGHKVYIHCWGGIGRTGTTAGCWLVRHGQSGEEALATIARHWQTVGKRHRQPRSPETEEQHDYVRNWQE